MEKNSFLELFYGTYMAKVLDILVDGGSKEEVHPVTPKSGTSPPKDTCPGFDRCKRLWKDPLPPDGCGSAWKAGLVLSCSSLCSFWHN